MRGGTFMMRHCNLKPVCQCGGFLGVVMSDRTTHFKRRSSSPILFVLIGNENVYNLLNMKERQNVYHNFVTKVETLFRISNGLSR